MATAADFRRIALALAGTSEAPHFDRAAFKVARIYTTLAANGRSANVHFLPEEQELKCLLAPELFQALDNAWGRQGWTRLDIAAAGIADIENALEMAWRHAQPKAAKSRPKTGAGPKAESRTKARPPRAKAAPGNKPAPKGKSR